ncbi:hypothetical protein B0H17DRAFT_1032715 [Mycena rosella]|uniref:Uncharacterized protein n=1 Tax=Mycena rosella TaxID=1033263 RepID=A0AAD7GXF0_MYCRO|nr:hypothetical protein B0H17DRAFT_1032715 [Mycena rosella]
MMSPLRYSISYMLDSSGYYDIYEKGPLSKTLGKCTYSATLRHPQGHCRIYIVGDQFDRLFSEMQRPAPELTSLALINFLLSIESCFLDWELFARTAPNLRHLRLDEFKNIWSSPLIHNLTTLHLGRLYDTCLGQTDLSGGALDAEEFLRARSTPCLRARAAHSYRPRAPDPGSRPGRRASPSAASPTCSRSSCTSNSAWPTAYP